MAPIHVAKTIVCFIQPFPANREMPAVVAALFVMDLYFLSQEVLSAVSRFCDRLKSICCCAVSYLTVLSYTRMSLP